MTRSPGPRPSSQSRSLHRTRPARFHSRATPYLPAELVRLVDECETLLPTLLQAIEGARERIFLEIYWFAADKTGGRFLSALIERARAGVAVFVLYDAIGSITTPGAFFADLEDAGARVAAYHPVGLSRTLWLWNRRDHRKLVAVDGRVAFVGGMNFCDQNAPRAWGGAGWRDSAIEIQGAAAVAPFERVFLRTYARVAGNPGPAVSSGRPAEGAPEHGPRVAVLANRLFRERFLIRRAYLHAIRHASRSVWIANPYFIPDGNVRRALRRAAKRGVDVRVLVPRRSDNPLTDLASRGLYGKLLRRGVRIYAFDGPMLHAKTLVVDGEWSVVGSYNFDNRSLRFNLEVAAAILDRRFGKSMMRSFKRDLGSARSITFEEWSRRSSAQRLMEWGASLLSAYL